MSWAWERLLTNRTTADEIKDLDTEKYFQEKRVSEPGLTSSEKIMFDFLQKKG